MNLHFSKKWVPPLLFIFISLTLTLVWFKQGLFYGGAEVGLSFYNPARFLQIQQNIWWGDVAPGMLVPHFITAVPFYFVLSLIQYITSLANLQPLVFFLLLILMGLGMYSFALSIFGFDKKNQATIAGIFYILNSYTMISVWHRFLYTGFFLAAFLPLLGLFWKQWLREGKFVYLVLFLITNLAACYMFGSLASVITIWLLFLLIGLLELFFPFKGKNESIKIIFRFFTGFIFWIFTNIWWLIPTFTISAVLLPEQHSSEDNISTLVNISKQTILPFTLQFVNPFYLFYTAELGKIYSSLFFKILSWLPAIVIFLGILSALKKKLMAGLVIIYLLVIFLSKGSATPFGHPFIWAFKNFYDLGVIRNPYEKLGILLPFFGSILFVLGLDGIKEWVKKRDRQAYTLLFVGIMGSIFIFAHPVFLGKVFDKPDYPVQVRIPNFYKDADHWFKLQKNEEGNILHLPFPGNDVVTYNWENGYHGVEINEILFTAFPSITRNIGIKRADDTLKSLSFIFNNPFLSDNWILNILQSLNVRYIVLHKDTKWDDNQTYGKNIKQNNPLELEISLNGISFLEKSAVFGDLVIYKLKDNFYQPKIILSNSYNLVDAGNSNIMQIFPLSQNFNQISSLDKEMDETLWENSSKTLIFPKSILYDWEPSREMLENMLSKSMTNPDDETLPFSQLQAAKRKFFSQSGEILSQAFLDNIILASGSILELNRARVDNRVLSQSVIEKYNDQIEEIFTKEFGGSSVQRIIKSLLAKVFTIHLYALEQLYKSGETKEHILVKEIHDKLNKNLIDSGILPAHFSVGKQINGIVQRRIHNFNVPKKASYELYITDANMFSLYPDALLNLDIQIDGIQAKVKMSNIDGLVSLGEVELEKGIHEISYAVRPSSNLISNLSEASLEGGSKIADNQTLQLISTAQTGSAATFILPKVNGGDTYEITFEGLVDKVKEFYIEMLEDSNGDNAVDNCTKTSCYTLEPSLTSNDWQKLSLTVTPMNLGTRKVNLRILLPPNSPPLPNSTLQIRNFQVNRIMDNELVLKRVVTKMPEISTTAAYLTEFRKISPVKYEGKIKLDKPSFMFFKETFHPGWILRLTNDRGESKIDKHFLGNLYGNTYYIDKVGEYNFKLEFEPQKDVSTGLILSTVSWVGILAVLLFTESKRKL